MTSLRFPDDLVELQAAWLATYAALARRPARAGTAAQRRRLISLSCRIAAHPYWTAPGRSRAALVELRRQARARRWAEAA
ncbi:hypothetical protein AB0469_18555 [Streptomyces sp. NPDC093801]|uniref:hypothetical protein n=1 Tax=Streptomyces sp. NPDC093801 TaxID=3155203 RepID=UPI00344B9555